MAGPSLPSIPDLAQLQFLPPGLNQMAGQQIQTAQQSADQGLALGAQDLRAKQLQNMFDESNNSTRLLRGKADLQGVNAENIIKDIEAKQRTELAPEELEAKRAKFVKELSDTKLAQANNDAQQMMLSDDPKIAAKGKDLFARSASEVAARAKAADEYKKQELHNAGTRDVANINAGATMGAARISADARKAAGKADPESDAAFIGALNKMTSAKARYAALNTRASMYPSDERWALAAEQLRPQAEAEINGNKPPQLDIPAIANKPAAPVPSIAPPGTPRAAPSKPLTSLPAGAKQIGTSGGKPVYQTPDGQKFLGE